MIVTISIFAVTIMLLTGMPTSIPGSGSSDLQSASSPSTNETTPFFPYLANTSAYPVPDTLPNETGSLLLPQLATMTVGNVPMIALAYIHIDTWGNHIVELRTATYNASMAQAIALSGCTYGCTQHIPIRWSAPIDVATYGFAPIQSISFVTGDTLGITDAIAVSANNSTEVYVSFHDGASGTWSSLTGPTPVWGYDPQVLLPNGCVVYLTTLGPNGARVTEFSITNTCNGPQPPGGGGGQQVVVSPQFSTSPPTVTEVASDVSAAGSTVTVNGTGFSSAQQVLFGGAAANFTIKSSTMISAVVPVGAGTTNVSVWNPGGWSAQNCSDEFAYGPTPPAHLPLVVWISPQSVASGAFVDIGGVNLGNAKLVTFGETSATFSVLSSTEIKVTVPTGSGIEGVTVRSSVGASAQSCSTLFHYSSPSEPAVTALSPVLGPSGTSVAITGTGFLSNSTVSFGVVKSSHVTYTSSTRLTATAPTSVGSVPVLVGQWGLQSPSSCSDVYTYAASTNPILTSLNRTSASSNTSVSIGGTSFASGSSVLIGGVPALPKGTFTSTSAGAIVPEGAGPVQVLVTGTTGNTPPVCADRFTITGPSFPPLPRYEVITRLNLTLPVLAGADLVNLITGYGGVSVLGTNATSHPGLTLFDVSPAAGQLHASTVPLVPVNESAGSTVFTSIGETRLSNGALNPAQVSAATSGSEAFIAMTTNNGGRTTLATLTTSNGGLNWSGPYLSGATEGSVVDPDVTITPAGYAFVTWLEGAQGDWQVEQAVYSQSGSLLQPPEPIYGGGGTGGVSASTPTLIVDPYLRPVYAWSAPMTGGVSQIEYTGAFLGPRAETSALWAGFNATQPADFENFGQPGLSQFKTRVTGLFTALTAGLKSGNLCSAETAAFELYGNVTWLESSPLSPGPTISGCHAAVGLDNSILANTLGPMDPNFYLSVGSDTLLESLGAGAWPEPQWAALGWQEQTAPAGAFKLAKPVTVHDSRGDTVTTDPWTVTPDSMWLNTSGAFQSESGTIQYTYDGGYCGYRTLTDQPVQYQVEVKINSGSYSSPYTSNTTVPSVYVSNLTALQSGTWGESVVVTFATTNTSENTCGEGPTSSGTFSVTTPAGWPTTISMALSGNFTTGLDPSPAIVPTNSTPISGENEDNDTFNWTNTIDANANIWLNATCNPSCSAHWNSTTYQLGERAEGQGLQDMEAGKTYNLAYRIQSSSGQGNWSWVPIYNAGQVSTAAPVEAVAFSCSFVQDYNPASTWISKTNPATNITGTTAMVTWYSAGSGFGWVTYNASWGGAMSQAAQAVTLTNGSTEYFAELHGLEPWAIYDAVGHVEVEEGCTAQGSTVGLGIDYPSKTTAFSFQTLAQVPLEEQDLPYDSVTQEGGGALIFWRVPNAFAKNLTFDNGSLLFYPKGNYTGRETIPLSPPLPVLLSLPSGGSTRSRTNTTFGLNITGLTQNTTYVVNLTLNYTSVQRQTIVATGEPFNFTYERDTSGDGLTDWEKLYGWTATYQAPFGLGWVNQHVAANPSLYATNGLVSDYLEKEYGLNPNTVDTAGSHMLDTWNLTFNLQPSKGKPASIPANLNVAVWNESKYYDPFAASVYASPGVKELGDPVGSTHNNTNITPTGAHGETSGDGSPWAAEALWNHTALEAFANLSGVQHASWLRGVIGSWEGIPTLTIWGKLSWGANPLAASTPGDYSPDGWRVNPVSDVGLEFSWVNATATGNSGDNFSVKMITSGVNNYSSPAVEGGTPGSVSDYSVVLPEGPNGQFSQNQTVELQVVVDTTGGLVPKALNGSHTAINVTYDLVRGTPLRVSVSGTAATLQGILQVVPLGGKVPTQLWIPTDNSTINSLPVGLTRYTGEQSFDMIVVNSSSTWTSDLMPLPWGGTTNSGITLSTGLNAFLIPREQFLYSPMGQALFFGKNTSYNASKGAPPLIGSSEESLISGFGGANYMVDLGAYWQNRAIWNQSGTITPSTESGVANGSANSIEVMAVRSPPSNDSGGLASSPTLYNSSDAPAAVQSIVTLNVSSVATLDLLLAALVDNTSGGSNAVNGTFLSVANQLQFLGLDGAIVNATPNLVYATDGLYGPPTTSFHFPSSSMWGNFWNSVTSVVVEALGATFSLVTVVWNAVDATFTFFNHIAHEAAAIGGQVLARAAGTLDAIGEVIENALSLFLSYITTLVKALLGLAFAPIVSAIESYTLSLASDVQAVGNDTANHRSPSADEARFWTEFSQPIFLFALGIAATLTIALTILDGLSFGTSYLLPLVVGLLVTGALAAVADGGGPSYISQFAGLNPLSPSVANELVNLSNSDWTLGQSTGLHQLDSGQVIEDLGSVSSILGAATTAWSFATIEAAWYEGKPAQVLDIDAAALGVLSIIMGGAAAVLSSIAGSVVSIVFDVASVIIDWASIKLPAASGGGFGPENGIIFAIDCGATILDITAFAEQL